MLVVGMGEALWDMLPQGKQIGGAPANFAYHVSQYGIDSCAISAIGSDELGDEIIKVFDEKKLCYSLPRVDYPTGTVQVTLDEEGVPCYDIKEDVAWDNIPFTDELRKMAFRTRAVCFGTLAQRSPISRETILKFVDTVPDAEGQLKLFDINLRQNFYNKEIIEHSLKRCNVLKINDEELIVLGRLFAYSAIDLQEKCSAILNDYKLKMVILTCGTNGSYVFTKEATSFFPTPKVKIADTVGAGDSFTATFCSAILKGHPIPVAHKLAVDVSAYVCTQYGAMPQLPEAFVKRMEM